MIDRVEPRGIVLVKEELVRNVVSAVIRERVENIGSSEEACRHSAAEELYQLAKAEKDKKKMQK